MFVKVDKLLQWRWREVLSSLVRLPGSLVVATSRSTDHFCSPKTTSNPLTNDQLQDFIDPSRDLQLPFSEALP